MDVTATVTDRSGNTASATATAVVSSHDLVITEGQDAAALIAQQPAGTQTTRRRVLLKGTHHPTAPLAPRAWTDLEIHGILDGSVPVTGWVRTADGWTASGYLPPAYTDGGVPEFTIGPYANSCKFRESLFINGIKLTRVTSLPVSSDTFHGDYAGNRITIGQDPTGKTVEMSRLPYLIRTTAQGVRLSGNWVARRSATPSQQAAVQLEGPDCEVSGGAVEWVHAIGLRVVNSHRTIVKGMTFRNCGQLGFACTSSHDVQWLNPRATDNNNEGYRFDDWESGGGKITRSLRTLIWGGFIQRNRGIGLWADIDNDDTKITWNLVEDNLSDGIRHEISRNAEIAHNKVYRNGLHHRPDSKAEAQAGRDPGPFATAGINVNSSGGRNGGRVWIHDNEVLDNRNGIFVQQRTRTDPTWLLKAVVVEGNTVRSAVLVNPSTGKQWVDANGSPVSGMSGIGALSQTATRNAEIWSTDVVFRNNRYGSTELLMRWTGSAWRAGSLAQSQAAGQETGSAPV